MNLQPPPEDVVKSRNCQECGESEEQPSAEGGNDSTLNVVTELADYTTSRWP